VARGTLYVFLSDGTLVITSPQTRPLVGAWKKTDHGLVRVEEPGKPVDISFVPAALETVPSP
jgi:hypothetical protein